MKASRPVLMILVASAGLAILLGIAALRRSPPTSIGAAATGSAAAAASGSGLAGRSADDPELARLIAANEALKAEVRGLREQLAAQTSLNGRDDAPRSPSTFKPGDERVLDVSPAELLDRARRCVITYDVPKVLDALPERVSSDTLGDVTLSERERNALNESYQAIHASAGAEVRRLYVEMGGDRQLAERLAATRLLDEMLRNDPDLGKVRARIAQENAGLAKPPTDLSRSSVGERALRLQMKLGQQLEEALAKRVGDQRAHELRRAEDGFGNKESYAGCPEQ